MQGGRFAFILGYGINPAAVGRGGQKRRVGNTFYSADIFALAVVLVKAIYLDAFFRGRSITADEQVVLVRLTLSASAVSASRKKGRGAQCRRPNAFLVHCSFILLVLLFN